jgi:hypothetical protein
MSKTYVRPDGVSTVATIGPPVSVYPYQTQAVSITEHAEMTREDFDRLKDGLMQRVKRDMQDDREVRGEHDRRGEQEPG